MQQTETIQQTQANETIQQVQLDTAPVRHVKKVTYTDVSSTMLRPVDTVTSNDTDSNDYLLLCNDTLFAPYANQPAHYRESMFADNGRSTDVPTPNMRQQEPTTDWIFGIIVLLFALMSLYLNRQKFKLRDIFLSLFDRRVQERVFRESNLKPRSLLPMTGIYLTSLSLIALNAAMAANVSYWGSNLQLFLIILGSLIAYIVVKTGFIRLLGSIFDDDDSAATYISNSYLFYFVGGLIALPLTLLLYYVPGNTDALRTATLIFVAILFIIRFIRSLQLILINSKNSKLYLFYYLCILEIVPILVTIKVLIF